MSETSRTDEVPHNVPELAMFARKIERELNTVIAERDALKAQLEVERDNHDNTRVYLKADISSLEFRLKEALKERDEARALCNEASRQRDGWRANAERLQNHIIKTIAGIS